MVSVWKDIGLLRQKNAARVDQINARQIVFHCNFLSSQMLFDSFFNISSAFNRRVVGYNNRFPPVNNSDAGYNSGGWELIVVLVERRQLAQFQERRIGIDQPFDSFSGKEFASGFVFFDGVFRSAVFNLFNALIKLFDQRAV